MNHDEEKTWATLAHLSPYLGHLAGVLGWVPPLIIWLVFKDRSSHVGAQAKEALNLQITLGIAMCISTLLCFILIGIPMAIVVAAGYLLLPLVGAMNANEPGGYRYPLTLRFVS